MKVLGWDQLTSWSVNTQRIMDELKAGIPVTSKDLSSLSESLVASCLVPLFSPLQENGKDNSQKTLSYVDLRNDMAKVRQQLGIKMSGMPLELDFGTLATSKTFHMNPSQLHPYAHKIAFDHHAGNQYISVNIELRIPDLYWNTSSDPLLMVNNELERIVNTILKEEYTPEKVRQVVKEEIRRIVKEKIEVAVEERIEDFFGDE